MRCRFPRSDYGFAEGEAHEAGRESIFRYRKSPVAVAIVFDGGAPEVKLNWWESVGGIDYGYLNLLTDQFVYPKLPRLDLIDRDANLDEYLEVMTDCLRIQADYLVLNGQDFLRGDWTRVAENAAVERERWKAAQGLQENR